MSISPLLVLEQGNGKGHRQLGRIRAVDRFAESQLIEKDAILGGQLLFSILYLTNSDSLPFSIA
jgi:hypothetical protein